MPAFTLRSVSSRTTQPTASPRNTCAKCSERAAARRQRAREWATISQPTVQVLQTWSAVHARLHA
eukprot:2165296-Rhodomonas_salina.3